jgi:hypothetical protein
MMNGVRFCTAQHVFPGWLLLPLLALCQARFKNVFFTAIGYDSVMPFEKQLKHVHPLSVTHVLFMNVSGKPE